MVIKADLAGRHAHLLDGAHADAAELQAQRQTGLDEGQLQKVGTVVVPTVTVFLAIIPVPVPIIIATVEQQSAGQLRAEGELKGLGRAHKGPVLSVTGAQIRGAATRAASTSKGGFHHVSFCGVRERRERGEKQANKQT